MSQINSRSTLILVHNEKTELGEQFWIEATSMSLVKQFGEMWARNEKNIEDLPGSADGGQGVYVLYDGSTPVYIGKGNIRQRLRSADASERRGGSWDYFSWYLMKDQASIHDVEVLLIRMLPPYLRVLNRQEGHFEDARSTDQNPDNKTPHLIDRMNLPIFSV
jgi:hypothetical protein